MKTHFPIEKGFGPFLIGKVFVQALSHRIIIATYGVSVPLAVSAADSCGNFCNEFSQAATTQKFVDTTDESAPI
jgi:hypothetical protein